MSAPNDRDAEALSWVHRGWEHLRAQRPLAAWGAWQRALLLKPDDPAATEALAIWAAAGDLPLAARTAYRFRSPLDEAGRLRWDSAFRGRPTGDLAVAAAIFGELAAADSYDATAEFNRGLCLAWAGENVGAIEALGRSWRADAEAGRAEAAVEAVALAEILRQGGGAETWADDLTHTLAIRIPADGGDPADWLAEFAELRELPLPLDPEAIPEGSKPPRAFEWLDRPMPEASPDLTADDLPRVLAGVVADGRTLAFTSPDETTLQRVEARLVEASPSVLEGSDRRSTPLPIRLMDASAFRTRLPEGMDEATRRRLARESLEAYFEGRWLLQNRRSLAGVGGESDSATSPASLALGTRDSAAEAVPRAVLEGILRVREQLGRRRNFLVLYDGYPFDRLRRRLGMAVVDGDVDPSDLSCLSGPELAKVDPASLDDAGLVEAFRSACPIRPDVAATLALAILDRDGNGPREGLSRTLVEAVRRDPAGAQAWIDRALALDGETGDGSRGAFLRTLQDEAADSISPNGA